MLKLCPRPSRAGNYGTPDVPPCGFKLHLEAVLVVDHDLQDGAVRGQISIISREEDH